MIPDRARFALVALPRRHSEFVVVFATDVEPQPVVGERPNRTPRSEKALNQVRDVEVRVVWDVNERLGSTT